MSASPRPVPGAPRPTKPTRAHLDHRAPLVIDTRDLGRRAGSMQEIHRTVPAPALLRTEMIGVPEGSELDIEVRLESAVEGVLVTGVVRGRVEGECGRCLEPISARLAARIQELFAYPESELTEDEGSRLIDDLIDLEPLVRDGIVLGFPLTPLCKADCQGLCVQCGIRLDDAPPDHGHDEVDPRWGALKHLMTEQEPEEI